MKLSINVKLFSWASLFFLASCAVGGDMKEKIQSNMEDLSTYEYEINEQNGSVSIQDLSVAIVAKKGTDLFSNTTGTKGSDNSPRAFFVPEGDFIFSAKVRPEFTGEAYEGGALVVYSNTNNWAKLLFEQFKSGDFGVATTINKSGGDDSYHGVRTEKTQYLKIVRHDDSYIFYSSTDGKDWNFLRHFRLPSDTPVFIGYTGQSPLGDELKVTFTDMQLKLRTITNFWQGE